MPKLEQARKKVKENPDDAFYLKELAGLLYTELTNYAREENIEQTEKILLELETLTKKNISVKDLLKIYGQAVLNTLPLIFAMATETKVREVINTMRSIAIEANSNMLMELLAMVLVNAIYDFSLLRKSSALHEFALELRDLSRENPENKQLQAACAKGMMNAVFYFVENNDKQASKQYFDVLLKLTEKFPKEEFVDSRRLAMLKEHFA